MTKEKAAAFFDDWDEALIWSSLQGQMGRNDAETACKNSAVNCSCPGENKVPNMITTISLKVLFHLASAWKISKAKLPELCNLHKLNGCSCLDKIG